MKVVLAGFNVDLGAIAPCGEGELTPETIAAAYARISRSPLSVDELRKIARKDVEKARQSNEKIVFEMGHSSIAEHAIFNIDIMGISRLLVEEVEKFRLVSFTEKSQRYCLFQDDFTLPDELKNHALSDLFLSIIRQQQHFYRVAYERLKSILTSEKGSYLSPTDDNLAKEDARYAISLATHTQLGMTINARNLELMIRRLAAHPLKEARTLSQALFETVHPIAPSLIRYTKPTDYDVAYHDLPEIKGAPSSDFKAVELIWFTPEADTRLVAALLYRSGGGKGFDECLLEAKQLPKERKREIVKESLRHLQPYDQVRREFEIVDLVYDLTVSATCFAQLKRHRMATILAQAYNPDLGITIPPRMLRAGLAEDFKKLIETTNESYRRLIREVPPAAPYILTNAHRRKLVLKVNARELYHISRLRLDRHAQWDIRSIVQEMVHEAQRVMPLTLLLAGGRNTYEENYQTIFSPKEEKSQ